ncbi:hypothetical protein H6504_01135 [Candidatus Woesearchaeota archaeon]|nr:hypothetical protein [Candidatus Woesearchaeota archaeon]
MLDGFKIICVHNDIFPLEVVYAAAYALLEKSYVFFEEDDAHVQVYLRPKDGKTDVVHLFWDQLICLAMYGLQSSQHAKTRQLLQQRVLLTAGYDPNREELLVPWGDPSD